MAAAIAQSACPAPVEWTDAVVREAFNKAPLAEASKQSYNAALRMISRCHGCGGGGGGALTGGSALALWLAQPTVAWAALQAAYPAPRTQHMLGENHPGIVEVRPALREGVRRSG